MAMLHAFHALQGSGAAFELRAIHVNHGIDPAASEWAVHCKSVCERLSVPLDIGQVEVDLCAGSGPEAAARDARYAYLASRVSDGEYCAAAHHADDQLETVLLQMFRGAGPDGLAAMPVRRRLGEGWLWRPLLGATRDEIVAYATSNKIEFVHDPSNEDHGVDRSYLRTAVIPRIKSRWPAAGRTVSRSARLCAEASALVADIAAQDFQACSENGLLSRSRLAELSAPRKRAAIRLAIARAGLDMPDKRQLENALRVLFHAKPDREPLASWPGGEIRAYRDRLFLLAPTESASPPVVELMTEGIVALGGLAGELGVSTAQGAGLLRLRRDVRYTVRFRQGGETLRVAGRGHSSVLRKLFQSNGIPAFMRDSVPLIYADDCLAGVGDLWIAEGWSSGPGERGLMLEWRPGVPLQ
jgi:tRNA(Ile)-lysidine synthase